MAIYIPAGHSLKDPGAIGYGKIKEADLTIELRNLIAEELRALRAKFFMDYDHETLAQVIKRFKPGTGSVLFDIHFNAFNDVRSKGTEVIVKDNPNHMELAMAKEICAKISTVSNIYNRGAKTESQSHRGRLGILHTKAGISALGEICFITNPDDLRLYQAAKLTIAKDIAAILVKYDAMVA